MYGLKWGWIRWLRVIWWSGIVVMPFSCILFWYPSAVNWGQCKSVVNRSSFNLSKWRRRCLNGPRKEKRIPSREKKPYFISSYSGPHYYIGFVRFETGRFCRLNDPIWPWHSNLDLTHLSWNIMNANKTRQNDLTWSWDLSKMQFG